MEKSKIFTIIFSFLAVISAGYLGYRVFHASVPAAVKSGEIAVKPELADLQPKTRPAAKPETNPATVGKPETSIKTAAMAGFKLYKNPDFGFEIQYPDSWSAVEEDIVNVRGENTKAFYFKKPGSDLRFAILPRDGLSYGLSANGTTTMNALIGGSVGVQTKYILADGRRLWLLHPQYGGYNWLEDIGRIDALTSALDPAGDTAIFEKMLNSFKLVR